MIVRNKQRNENTEKKPALLFIPLFKKTENDLFTLKRYKQGCSSIYAFAYGFQQS